MHSRKCLQKNRKKKKNLKYVNLTVKETEAIGRDILSVDLIVQYIIRRGVQDDPLITISLNMIKTKNKSFEIVQYNDK